MVRKAALITALALGLLACSTLTPRRAAATQDLVYIIPAGIAGAAAVIVLVAILFADREDPDFMPLVPEAAPARGDDGAIAYGVRCRPDNGNLTLLCW